MTARVLVVDDEEDIRTIAQIALEAVAGLEVHQAATGAEAIEAAREIMPDVILLDVMMPGVDGLEALERLRADEVLARIPVVFMTARVQKHEIEDYKRRGAAGVIEKPFEPMKLAENLERILRGDDVAAREDP